MVQGCGVATEAVFQVTLVGLLELQVTLMGPAPQSGPWASCGVHFHQQTALHLDLQVLGLGKLADAACCGDSFCHHLLELHRTLVCGV